MTMIIKSISIVLAASCGCNAFHHPPISSAGIGIRVRNNNNNNNNNNNRPSIFIPVNDLIMMHHPSAKLRHSSIPSSTLPKMSSSSDNDSGESTEVEKLRQTASKLRAEAQEAEKGLKRSPSSSAEENKYVKPVEYSTLSDSCWEITYRFANEPESNKDDNNDNNNNKNNNDENNTPQRKFYAGKLQLQFRGDGYTDIIIPAKDGDDDDVTNSGSNSATFQKVWGWDLETSAEDTLDYLLFSADVAFPPPIGTSERVYFQARVDREGKNEDVLSLKDGSVTVKRNVEAPGGGSWWGIFRGAEGILAQFRSVGEFKCRPIAIAANPDPSDE